MTGIYIVLVTLALYFLCQRKPVGARILGCLLVGMCVLGTTEMVMQAVNTTLWLRALHAVTKDDPTASRIGGAERSIALIEYLLVVTNKFVLRYSAAYLV